MVRRGPGCLVGAFVVALDDLFQDGIRVDPDLVHGIRIQLMRLMGDLAGALARQCHDFFGTLLVTLPQLDPFIVKSAFFGRSDQRLVSLADLGVSLDDRGQNLFSRGFLLGGLAQHVLADHVAIGDDPGAQLAEHADARKPVCGDVHGIGVDRPDIPDRKQPHARDRNQQECDDGGNFGTDGDVGEHVLNLFSERVGTSDARWLWDQQNEIEARTGYTFLNSICRNNA
jgi:hypothetical protein